MEVVVVVEQSRREVLINKEVTIEDGLQARKPHYQYPRGVHELPENSTYLDKNGGAVEDLDIHNILSGVHVNDNGETKTEVDVIREERRGRFQPIEEEEDEEILEEEVVELEFEKAITKLDSHSMHCPNCDHRITKVVVRRKIIKRKPRVIEEPHEPLDLLGCFSCFSLFTSTDSGRFNPFPIFWNKPGSSADQQPDGNEVVSREDGNCFSIFRVFRKEKDYEQPVKIDQDYERLKPRKDDDITHLIGRNPIRQGVNDGPNGGETSEPKDQVPRDQSCSGVKLPGPHETNIDIPLATTSAIVGQTHGLVGDQDSTSFEILKSVVYGGLMEVIASLSIVASAAAGDAATLSIIALAMANLIGGIFVIGHNLWDLKDDCYKFYTQQTNNQQPRTKYKELLGPVEHFPMHVFFAILSFLVFGIIPPMAYGYSFQKTNDKDFTMLVVAIASLVCVGLLAIFKSYIDRCSGFVGYFKTIMYYLTTAVTVSGLSYVAGNLVMRFIREVGWFETSSAVAMTNPSLAYY